MKKWIALLLAAALALAGYVAAGPYLTMRAIGNAVRAQDAAALAQQVDFPALRGSIKQQLTDRMLREVGGEAASNPLVAMGMSLMGGMAGTAVDMLVTPSGLAALAEGRKVWDRASGEPMRGSADAAAQPSTPRPLSNAVTHYVSTSRFTATITDSSGRPVVFVLTRDGIRWKLSDVRLPL